jgi:hypothetical protein
MKKIQIILIGLFAAAALSVPAFSQESLIFGMRGNPQTLAMNPGAETGLAFYLGLPSVSSNVQFTRPLSSYLGDINSSFSNFTTPAEQITLQLDQNVIGLGMKFGKNVLFFGGIKNQIDARVALDNDLARFALNGMRDAQGNIDPNYQGDFSDTELLFSDRLTASAGLQVKVTKKLRVGASFNHTRVVSHLAVQFNSLEFNSTSLANGLNELSISAAGGVSYYGILDHSMGQKPNDIATYFDELPTNQYAALVRQLPRSNCFDFGATFRPIERLRITGSVLGLGAGKVTDRGFQIGINNSLSTSGFQWNAADTGVNPLKSFFQEVQDSLKVDLGLAPPTPISFKPYQNLHVAAYFDLAKWHSIGIRYSQVARPSVHYSAIAAEYHANLLKGLQISGAYTKYLNGSQPMSNQFAVAFQMRVLPPLQVYLSSSAFGMLPSFDFSKAQPLIPSNLDRLNVNIGFNLVFFERKSRSEKKTRNKVAKTDAPAAPVKK